MENPDYVFACKKCNHLAYTSSVCKLFNYDCPRCGTDALLNWILVGKGDYKKDNEQKTKNN